MTLIFLISNFRPVLNVVCFLLGNSPPSEFYVPTFRNALSVPSSQAGKYEVRLDLRKSGVFTEGKVWFENIFEPNLFLYKYSIFSQIHSYFVPIRLWRWKRQSVSKHHHHHHHHVPEGVRHVILFLDPQDGVGPSISSSVVLCFFFLLVYIVVLVLVVCLCPSFVHVVATFPGTFYFLYYVLCSSFLPNTVIPRLTKIIRSGITFVSRNLR